MPETTPVYVVTQPVDARALERFLSEPRTALLLHADSGIAVDHPMVTRLTGAVRHPLGGCACCGPSDEMTRALRAILPRARRGEVDRVVVVAVARDRVLAALRNDPVVAAVYRLADAAWAG
jgi:G3E family GTPase